MSRPAVILLALLGLAACDARGESFTLGAARYDITAVQQWLLPLPLREISGLAVTADGRLLAMNDELAMIYQLDPDAGRIVKRFSFGRLARGGDYEGIAVAAGQIWLVTSDGALVHGAEGADDTAADYTVSDTRLGKQCEVEGLATSVDGAELYLLCKTPRNDDLKKRISVFRYVIAEDRLLEDPISVKQKAVRQRADSKGNIRPSGIAVSAVTGHLLIVAADEKLLIEMTIEGDLVDAVKLPLKDSHPQAEGIELLPDGRLLIADEGAHERGRLTVYAPAH